MTIRTSIVSFLGICSVSFAGGLGCQSAQPSQPSDAREGTIDFVVRQSPSSRAAVANGSFDVRGIDNDEHTRVGIGHGTTRTLHVRLPPGAYALGWNPTLPVDAASQASGADQEWPQIVVVTPDCATVVDVVVSTKSTRAEPVLALASAGNRGAL
ncbi:MAG: hypothetical protein ABI895_14290 [Deltaproteobacteria bacterium]